MNALLQISCSENDFTSFFNFCAKLVGVRNGAVNFSFDNDLSPFISSGRGYSRPENRISLTSFAFANEVKRSLVKHYGRVRAGRIFIGKDRLFYKNENGCRIDIAEICLQ